MTQLTGRLYREGDERGIVQLYNLITGRARTVEQHRWEWLETPQGQGSMWVITEGPSGEIVGHHGLIPIKASYFGQPILLGKTENSILHPKYQGTGIYFLHERRFVKQAVQEYDLLYTTSGHGTPRKIRMKLGYRAVGSYADYIKVLSLPGLVSLVDRGTESITGRKWFRPICKTLCAAVWPVLFLIFRKKCRQDTQLEFHRVDDIDQIAEEIDSFWTENKQALGITIDRSSRYFKWRIFQNPNVKYEFLLARKKRKIAGYAISRTGGHKLRKGIIVDVVVADNDEDTFLCIVDDVLRRFKQDDISIVAFPTLASTNFLNKTLRNCGFYPMDELIRKVRKISGKYDRNTENALMVRICSDKTDTSEVENPNHWYYTELFKEGAR